MSYIKDCLEIACMIGFLIFLYRKTYKPYIREVRKEEAPPRKKKRLKYLRRLRVPYRGKTQIIQYDKTHGYIESAWNEIEKPKKLKTATNKPRAHKKRKQGTKVTLSLFLSL